MSLEAVTIIGFALVIYYLWKVSDKLSDVKLQMSDNNSNELGELIEKIDHLTEKVDSIVDSFSDLKSDDLAYIRDSLEEINDKLTAFRSVDGEEIKNKLDTLIDSVDRLDQSHDL